MGSRANYIITEGNRHQIYFSHWGAQSVSRDFFFGPEIAIQLVRSTRPVDQMLNQVWAEGGAIIDLDAKRLRFFGGEWSEYDVQLRELSLEMMEISWDGWNVSWADEGMLDFARHMGLPLTTVQVKFEFLSSAFNPSALTLSPPASGPRSFVTIRYDDGVMRDAGLGCGAEPYLLAGPQLIDLLKPRPDDPIPEGKAWPHQMIFLDVPQQTMWVALPRFGTVNSGAAPAIEALWPGWRVHLHNGGMPLHLRLSGREPARWERPMKELLQDLAKSIMIGDINPQELITLASSGLSNPQINPSARQEHRLDLPENQRMERFLKLLAEWKRRHGRM